MFVSKSRYIFAVILFTHFCSLPARDIIVEFKGAYFRPTDSCFKKIFHKGGALFGPEVTVQLCEDQCLYAFASVDYMRKEGRSLGLCDRTKVQLLPLAFGLKYFMPFYYNDFYVGIGFQPTRLKTENCSPFVNKHTTQWCLGGVAKFGVYIDLSCNFVLDLFIDYSFVHAKCSDRCFSQNRPVIPLKANISGAIFGGGIGYRFD